MSVDFEGMAETDVSEDALKRLSDLAHRQLELEREIGRLEYQIKELGKHHRKISEEDIPSLLDETGLSEIRLSDGTKVLVKEDLRVSTTGKHRDAINRWLEETGHDDVIKDEVVAQFGKGEGERAAMLMRAAAEFTDATTRKRYVNPQTFSALLRELMAAGEEVPLEELGAYIQRRSKLESPK